MQLRRHTQDGFPGQRLRVLPAPLTARARHQEPTDRLLVTDVGYFPRARSHGIRRPNGATGAVVIVCAGGVGRCDVEGRVSEVHADQALVIPPGVGHAYWADVEDPWTIWWLHAEGADVAPLLAVMAAQGQEAIITVRDARRAIGHIEQALTCLERDETLPSLLKAAGAGWALLAEIAADRHAGSGLRGEPVADAQEYLRARLDAPVSVPTLATRAGLSTSHFSALFRAATGGGVVEYVKRLRMARARELLMTTTWTITEIATAVGYSDALYFSRQFRAVNDCSPSQYRSQSESERDNGQRVDDPDPGSRPPP